ncbi:hypothetical protein SAMN02745947_02696 [Rhodococcus rhodochrous J3]|jgi:vacuolar-type H+-ATPase subunit I/STV1|uniref:DUF7144 domain-containing protein n=2 Tax=Rhodococcus rhodochrous TaxID=1829 RepID=A0AA46WYG9_RHORH|nr:hypothetical protein [Rhodococcus rhodochrous]MBF4479295.1 hypothetical protein [Rhodococcus rhodochrous]MCB8913687.1 hypothetical protein [Rhodococcus rhodochrous]MCD2098338.1 hypothetical protein [Rhodococcus rhodochrous]MCD2122393.1 hypothetical protein [Rhodococcus rhodochrous]MCQ4134107.1 hypothetical protein [Rhodococcus rhodochrous]
MSHNVHADREEMSIKQGLATGTSVGAAIIMTLIGALQLLQGIAAVAEDEVFVTGQEYLFTFDLTTWGWVHIVVGVVMVIVGIALISGATWARVSAMVIAALSILVNFMWLPYYPGWALAIIALDIVVIWAIATWNPRAVYS